MVRLRGHTASTPCQEDKAVWSIEEDQQIERPIITLRPRDHQHICGESKNGAYGTCDVSPEALPLKTTHETLKLSQEETTDERHQRPLQETARQTADCDNPNNFEATSYANRPITSANPCKKTVYTHKIITCSCVLQLQGYEFREIHVPCQHGLTESNTLDQSYNRLHESESTDDHGDAPAAILTPAPNLPKRENVHVVQNEPCRDVLTTNISSSSFKSQDEDIGGDEVDARQREKQNLDATSTEPFKIKHKEKKRTKKRKQNVGNKSSIFWPCLVQILLFQIAVIPCILQSTCSNLWQNCPVFRATSRNKRSRVMGLGRDMQIINQSSYGIRKKKNRKKFRQSLKPPVDFPRIQLQSNSRSPTQRSPVSHDFTSLMMKGASVCRPRSGSGDGTASTGVHYIDGLLSVLYGRVTDAYNIGTTKVWSLMVDIGAAIFSWILSLAGVVGLGPTVGYVGCLSWLLITSAVPMATLDDEDASLGDVQLGHIADLMNFIFNRMPHIHPGVPITPIASSTSSGVLIAGNGLHPVNSRYREHFEYHRVGFLGTGGYGDVYLCQDATTDKLVAVKQIPLEKFDSREVQVPLVVQPSSPRVIHIYGVVVEGLFVRIFMEVADGGSWLFTTRQALGSSHDGRIKRMVKDALRAIGSCHVAGVAHCDLKPENFLLRQNGSTVLSDFGSCNGRILSPKTTGRTKVYRSPYESPASENPKERLERWKRGDMRSLGLSILVLICGPQIASSFESGDPRRLVPLSLNPGLIDLLYQLLTNNAGEQLTAKEALDHFYISGDAARAVQVCEEGAVGGAGEDIEGGAGSADQIGPNKRKSDFDKWMLRHPQRAKQHKEIDLKKLVLRDPQRVIDAEAEIEERGFDADFDPLKEDVIENGNCGPTTMQLSQSDWSNNQLDPGVERRKRAGTADTQTSGYTTSNWPADHLDIGIVCDGKTYHLPVRAGSKMSQLIPHLEREMAIQRVDISVGYHLTDKNTRVLPPGLVLRENCYLQLQFL